MIEKNHLKKAETLFSEFLQKKTLKLTSQRRSILKEAIEAKGHFSADQLLEYAKREDPTISKATVYRTLALLTDSRLLEEQDFGDGKKLYERAEGRRHHDHLVCIQCGKIIEFENDEIEKLQDGEAKRYQFRVVYHSHKLFGFCAGCNK